MENLSDMDSCPPTTMTMLSKMLNTSCQNITKLRLTIQRRGYLLLEDNAEGHRSLSVLLTNQGTEILHRVAHESSPLFAELFSNITKEKLEVVSAVVVKLINKLNQMQEESE